MCPGAGCVVETDGHKQCEQRGGCVAAVVRSRSVGGQTRRTAQSQVYPGRAAGKSSHKHTYIQQI